MASISQSVITSLDSRDGGGEATVAVLFPLAYEELRRLAGAYLGHERPDHTLQATALVNEAYLRLVGAQDIHWQGRAHFFRVAARAIRRVLVDHARGRNSLKRGGDSQRVSLDTAVVDGPGTRVDLLGLDDALEQLALHDERQSLIVEMRFFAGMTNQEVAQALGMSLRTVEGDWAMAKAWLRQRLGEAP